jgi:hypothetical protein
MHAITAIEEKGEVQFVSVRPVEAVGDGTSVAVEVNASLRVLGAYLDELEQSRWAIRIRDLQLARNPERMPPVSARFVLDTPVSVNGFGRAGAVTPASADDGVP